MTKLLKQHGITFMAGLVIFSLFAVLFATPVFASEADSDSTDANVTFTSGQLKLNSVPSLNFGSHAINDELAVYTAENTSLAPIEVSDLRGSGDGWKLLVSLSKFRLDSSDPVTGPFTLGGAQIDIAGLAASSVNGTVGTTPSVKNPVTLVADGTAEKVFFAALGDGKGVWQANVQPSGVSLTVLPGTAEAGNNVANLNWSLENTP